MWLDVWVWHITCRTYVVYVPFLDFATKFWKYYLFNCSAFARHLNQIYQNGKEKKTHNEFISMLFLFNQPCIWHRIKNVNPCNAVDFTTLALDFATGTLCNASIALVQDFHTAHTQKSHHRMVLMMNINGRVLRIIMLDLRYFETIFISMYFCLECSTSQKYLFNFYIDFVFVL